MANLIYDAALSFGKLSSITTTVTEFPNILNLGAVPGKSYSPNKDKPFIDVDGMTVDVCISPKGAWTDVTIAVSGSKDGDLFNLELGYASFTKGKIKNGVCRVPINPYDFQFLRVSVSANGNTAAEAFLNTYAGK